MFGLDPRELVILVGIIVLLFGAKKIPDLARSIGESIKILRNGGSDSDDKKGDKNN